MSSLKHLSHLEYPQTHTVLPSPSAQSGYHISGKEVEVRDSGSWHHQLCHRHRVPTQPKPSGSLLSCPLLKTMWFSFFSFKTAWSSVPSLSKPCGPLTSPPKRSGPLSLWLLLLGLNSSTSLPLQPHFRLLLQSVTPASIPYSSSFTGLP